MSPFMTVAILTVLWLIVVVPMIVHRGDKAARTRAQSRTRRRVELTQVVSPAADSHRQWPAYVAAGSHPARPHAARGPVLAAEETTMESVHQTDISAPREAMLRRRRRSLSVLAVGSVISVLLAGVTGGATWFIAGAFVLGTVGYFYSLRKQALRDRERRAARQLRAATSPIGSRCHQVATVAPVPESAVRIDDEDVELYAMDTVDLSGVYVETAWSTSRNTAGPVAHSGRLGGVRPEILAAPDRRMDRLRLLRCKRPGQPGLPRMGL